MEAIINIGLSGSGKTVNNSNYPNHKIISKDIIRKTLIPHNPSKNFWISYPYPDKSIENKILEIMQEEIIASSENNENIIIDNTNLSSYRTFKLKEFLRKLGYNIKINNYNTTEDINFYLKNNKKRLDCVESSIINDQFITACLNEVIELEPKEIVIVDIENTIRLKTSNSNLYQPNRYVLDLLHHLIKSEFCDYIQFISNTDSSDYCKIFDWLCNHNFDMNLNKLLCRRASDKRSEISIKMEMFNSCFEHHNILLTLEDNLEMFKLYEYSGIPSLLVSN